MSICDIGIVTFGFFVFSRKRGFQAVMIQPVLVHVEGITLSSRHTFPSLVSHPAYVSILMCRSEVGVQYWILIICICLGFGFGFGSVMALASQNDFGSPPTGRTATKEPACVSRVTWNEGGGRSHLRQTKGASSASSSCNVPSLCIRSVSSWATLEAGQNPSSNVSRT